MAIPNYETILQPLLKAAAAGGQSVDDVRSQLALEFGLSADELAETYPSGIGVFADIVEYAKRCLLGARLLAGSRSGELRITPRGKALLEQDLTAIDYHILSRCMRNAHAIARPRPQAGYDSVAQYALLEALEQAYRRSPSA